MFKSTKTHPPNVQRIPYTLRELQLRAEAASRYEQADKARLAWQEQYGRELYVPAPLPDVTLKPARTGQELLELSLRRG